MKLIYEDAAIEAVRKALSEYNGEYDCRSRYGVIADAIENIKNLLPAQYERKTGHWIEHENADIVDGYYVSMYECSCCHTWENDDSEYCPDCGADMRGEENEID